jgi:hypothetical protein
MSLSPCGAFRNPTRHLIKVEAAAAGHRANLGAARSIIAATTSRPSLLRMSLEKIAAIEL